MNKILDTVCRHPIAFLIGSILFALPFLCLAPFVKTVDNVDYFTLENDPDVEFYNEFKKVFKNDEFFVIAFEKADIFTVENLTLLKEITEELDTIDEVREIRSLANIDETIGSQDYFEIRKFLEDIPKDRKALEKLKKRALANPLYLKNLISPDARTAAIIVRPYNLPDDRNYRKRLIGKCKVVLNRYDKKIDQIHLAGRITTNLSLSEYMIKDLAVFVPVTFILIILIVALVFMNIRLTLLAAANISICVGSTMGLFTLFDTNLNNVNVIVIPLIMALALCDTVHIFSHMEKRVLFEFPTKQEAFAGVLKKVIYPCFLTSLTTAVGFLSLSVSKIPPIKEFAFIASTGMVLEFVFSFFFLSPLILFFSPEKLYLDCNNQYSMVGIFRKINNLVQKHAKGIAILSLMIVLIAAMLTTKIDVDTNLLDYFKKRSPVRIALDFVEKEMSGVGSLDISLKADGKDAFKEPQNLEVVESIQKRVKTLEGVDVAISFVNYIKDMNKSFHNENPNYYTIPKSRSAIAQYLLLYDSELIEDFINDTYDHARIAIRISKHSTSEQAKLIDEIKQIISETLVNSALKVRVTGRAVHDVNTIEALVKGQIYSLSIAVGIISLIMVLVLKSFTIGVLSLFPNLFPIIINFGIMGAFGIPLNTSTSLIAAVAIGIAVDDTIHYLSEYRAQRAQGKTISISVDKTIHRKGLPIISSSLILCLGFGVMSLSNFVPVIDFGFLSAIIMITAVIGDLVVLPSILLLKSGRRKAPVQQKISIPNYSEYMKVEH